VVRVVLDRTGNKVGLDERYLMTRPFQATEKLFRRTSPVKGCASFLIRVNVIRLFEK
jgi:hypothetical protein